MLKVQVAEIPEEGLQIDVGEDSWFPDQELKRRDDLQASVFLSGQSGRILVSGSITVTIVLNCDRCLAEFPLPRKIDFQLALELEKEDQALLVADHECDRSEMDVVYLSEPVIDVGDILYQQIILSLPQKTLCRKDCHGFCGKCGADLNNEECHCPKENGGSPFSVLGQLLKDKK